MGVGVGHKSNLPVEGVTWYEVEVEELAGHFRGAGDVREFSLPLPGGGMVEVELLPTTVLENADGLLPDLATYVVRGKDDAALRGSLTFVDGRVYGSVRSPRIEGGEQVLVDPISWHAPGTQERRLYLSFRKDAFSARSVRPSCSVKSGGAQASRSAATPPGSQSFGTTKYTLRLALAATVQYGEAVTGLASTDAQFVSNTVAAEVVAINRVNEVYLDAFATTFTLVDSAKLVSTSPTDGLSSANDDGVALIDYVPTWILDDKSVDTVTFNLGHVFSTGGGGIAAYRSACAAGRVKCQGVTGLPNPVGDPFYINYVAHELGHQCGGSHTFNSETGSCCCDNRAAQAAVEPGSGISVMAYAGICGQANDLAENSIASFSWYSLMEMNFHIASACVGLPNAGAVVITSVTPDFSVPAGTGFRVEVNATGAVAYSCEEGDVGVPADLSEGDLQTNPLARPYLPTVAGVRYFDFGAAKGMIEPTTARLIRVRCVAYDNSPSGGHIAVSNIITVTVDTSTGPMTITSPKEGAVVLPGDTVDLAWNVAGTDALSPQVDIYVDTSGAVDSAGTKVKSDVPNSGSTSFVMPTYSGTAVIRVMAQSPQNFYSARSVAASSASILSLFLF